MEGMVRAAPKAKPTKQEPSQSASNGSAATKQDLQRAKSSALKDAVILSAISAAVSTVVATVVSYYIGRADRNRQNRERNPSSADDWTSQIVVDGVSAHPLTTMATGQRVIQSATTSSSPVTEATPAQAPASARPQPLVREPARLDFVPKESNS